VRQIFDSLDKTIRAVGGTGLNDMVTMTVFITDVRNGDRLTQIRKEIFKDCFPASALITVTGLARPGLLIEIQGMAGMGGKRLRSGWGVLWGLRTGAERRRRRRGFRRGARLQSHSAGAGL